MYNYAKVNFAGKSFFRNRIHDILYFRRLFNFGHDFGKEDNLFMACIWTNYN